MHVVCVCVCVYSLALFFMLQIILKALQVRIYCECRAVVRVDIACCSAPRGQGICDELDLVGIPWCGAEALES